MFTSIEELDDETLVSRFQDGDLAALDVLLERYRRFARAKARTYFLVGAEADDIIQEGMIGLYKAARDFRHDRQSSFRAFADLCVTRQVITAVKTATRRKHQPLNRYVSFSATPPGADGQRVLEDLLTDHHMGDIADEVAGSEALAALRQMMVEVLSRLEVDVLRLYIEGRTYQEISEELGRHHKSIDNALQRIKRKLDFHLSAQEAERALIA